jgi:hypothetical protein
LLQHPCRFGAAIAVVLALICAAPERAPAAHGDCGQPTSDGEIPVSSDCLQILRVGIGIGACDPTCICDVNSSATTTAADALLCLKKAVGQDLELDCPCGGQSTTSTVPTSTTIAGPSTTTSTTTTTLFAAECPNQLELWFLAGVRAQCATNDDCGQGLCDETLGRCVTETRLDLGWTGNLHGADINDSARFLSALTCAGAPPSCGACTIDDIDPSARNCRCADENRHICDEPFGADVDDCGGNLCICYFGPPLPLSVGTSPLCLVNRMTRAPSGSFAPDTGDLSLDLDLRSMVYDGEELLAPCPSCGGRCLAPEEKVDTPCTRSSDCDTETEEGECGRFDEVADDGVREGLCVGGPSAGFGCDINAFNTTFPAPGGSGYSFDCFPDSAKNIGGQGLIVPLHHSTAPQSLEANVACGFPPVSERLCPCGVCSGDPNFPCSSNSDCEFPATCAAVPGSALPNLCDDEVCTAGDGSEGACLGGPVDKFCDEIVRANGRGLLGCQTNADCEQGVTGVIAGACAVEEPRPCFVPPISSAGRPDPRSPLAVTVACVPPLASSGLNSGIGLPGPVRLETAMTAKAFCNADSESLYVPGQGCE